MTKSRFRSQYSGAVRCDLNIPVSARIVKGSFADECDINRIMSKYQRTGILPDVSKLGQYLDVSNVTDYASALNMVSDAQDLFDALPAHIRQDCYNDPAVFLDRATDPSWLLKHGLASTPLPAAAKAPMLGSGGSDGQANNGRGASDRSIDPKVGGAGERQAQTT